MLRSQEIAHRLAFCPPQRFTAALGFDPGEARARIAARAAWLPAEVVILGVLLGVKPSRLVDLLGDEIHEWTDRHVERPAQQDQRCRLDR